LLLNLADVYQRIGRLAEAKLIYERLVDTDPDSAPALGGLGWVYLQEGQHQTALTLFTRQKLTDLTAESLYNLGCTFLALGDLHCAKTYFGFILDDPGMQPLVHFALARVYIQEKDYVSAKELVTSYLNEPNRELRALAYFTLGRIAYESARWKNAVRYLKLCSMLKPELPDCAFWLGLCFRQLGQEQESQKWLTYCKELFQLDRSTSSGAVHAPREKATTARLQDV
ncbi:MAG: hypothetical protein JWN30_117, partial [Bacilli bacterium]|nr:hypothetical protein [Bacilli bacterium]